jgi:hypothetical protein
MPRLFQLLALLISASLLACSSTATCQEACDRLYECLPDTSTPKSECVNKCETDSGKGDPENRSCIADSSCENLKSGKCPDLIVR